MTHNANSWWQDELTDRESVIRPQSALAGTLARATEKDAALLMVVALRIACRAQLALVSRTLA